MSLRALGGEIQYDRVWERTESPLFTDHLTTALLGNLLMFHIRLSTIILLTIKLSLQVFLPEYFPIQLVTFSVLKMEEIHGLG